MRQSSMNTPNATPHLLVRCGAGLFALRVSDVVEITRPLFYRPMAGAPRAVMGLSIIRGIPVPVVNLAVLATEGEPESPTRFVVVRAGERRVALAVGAVVGIRECAPSLLSGLPPLLSEANAELFEEVGRLDAELLTVLKAGSLVPESIWPLLSGQEVS